MTRFVLISTMNFSRMRTISHCMPSCVTDQWNANYPSCVCIRLVYNSVLENTNEHKTEK